MKYTLFLAALLLLGVVATPVEAQTDAADLELTSSSCTGVVLDNTFTGFCSYGCYGDIFVNDRWFASWTC